jgi:hypothetical protein
MKTSSHINVKDNVIKMKVIMDKSVQTDDKARILAEWIEKAVQNAIDDFEKSFQMGAL